MDAEKMLRQTLESRAERLVKLIQLNAPLVILANEAKLVYEAAYLLAQESCAEREKELKLDRLRWLHCRPRGGGRGGICGA